MAFTQVITTFGVIEHKERLVYCRVQGEHIESVRTPLPLDVVAVCREERQAKANKGEHSVFQQIATLAL